MSNEETDVGGAALVPDFTVAGFDEIRNASADLHAHIKDLLALKLAVCVGASYNASTKKIIFTIPVYGDFSVTSPFPIPIGGSLKACAATCGSIIPTGLKVTVYLSGKAIYNGTLVGSC